ncbi:Xylosidase : arabinofuranosidase [Lasiodiplodia theobromae]|uniref:Xylosidase: arabinofuranosidase n=1 Tax=Lasiodiplodia theobromae TaxID=45133 RepID=UPI0015C3478E|nr:Xylosidase : arabinofuranosidase [Lasiodiplodia theobromae]KAF4534282.1 Xylosidase : arabinofuranosidase [Lasiodiplodia theobromae]
MLALASPGQPFPTTTNTTANSTYTNPLFPGWHSDPTCIFVPSHDSTYFCSVSTFLGFPGLPIYASKDLQNWKHVSNAYNRASQFPDMNTYTGQNNGVFAPTLRYHDGVFYNIVVMVAWEGLIFKTTDPFDDAAWSDPVRFTPASIDPDLFWDDDGTVYVTYAGIQQSTIDLDTGAVSDPVYIWNGTGGASPEGPHLYKKDGWYYLMIAEGGTELGHTEIIARSRNVSGPYEAFEGNPILTNSGTDEYFQTVGHADLFQDAAGHWWGIALSTRSGPAWTNYPMGRETVLFPASWEDGEWPVLQPVRGRMEGWPLPAPTRDVPGEGPFVGDADVIGFAPGEGIPKHFLFWRFPPEGAFAVSPEEATNALRLVPSKANLTGGTDFEPTDGITFVGRRQTDTLFDFSVDVAVDSAAGEEEEAGVTVFLTQDQHLDLGVVLLASDESAGLAPHLRFRVNGTGNNEGPAPETVVEPVPEAWLGGPVRLYVQALNDTHYTFSAGPSDEAEEAKTISHAPATIVSGGSGPFTGTLVGVYATSNGGDGKTPAYISRWRYEGKGQKISDTEIVPSK